MKQENNTTNKSSWVFIITSSNEQDVSIIPLPERFNSISTPSATPIVSPEFNSITEINLVIQESIIN